MAAVAALMAPRLIAYECAGLENATQTQRSVFVPLRGVKINAHICDFVAQVVLEQRYTNYNAENVNAQFSFPLPENAAVCDFEAQIDAQVIKGIIKEKTAAKQEYEDAVKEGKGAYLIEKKGESNAFTISIGNLLSRKSVTVKLTYIQELKVDEMKQGIQFSFPAAIEPTETNYYQVPNIEHTNLQLLNKPNQENKGMIKGLDFDGVELNVTIDMPCNIRAIQFAPNSLPEKAWLYQLETHESQGQFHFKEPSLWWFTKPMEMDIILEKPHEPRVWIEKSTNNKGEQMYSAMFVCYPELGSSSQSTMTEIVFVIDRSGSMDNTIGIAKDTLNNAVKQLPPNSSFNIVSFGSSYSSLFPQSQPSAPDCIDTALKHIDTMSADMGGTNLFDPLNHIYSQQVAPNCTRQIFCISDGEADSRSECIDLTRKNAHHTRVFSFGIGNNVDKKLIQGIAEKGFGKAEFLASGCEADMGIVVLKQLKRALQPAYTKTECKWQAVGKHLQSPTTLPPLFNKERYLVYTMIPASAVENIAVEQTVQLHARAPTGEMVHFSLPLHFGQAKEGNLIHRLAARSIIRELEDGNLRDTMGVDKATALATELALSYSLVSNNTSFVAVEQQVTVDPETLEQTINHKVIPLPQQEEETGEEEENAWCGGCGGNTLGIYKQLPNFSIVNTYFLCYEPPSLAVEVLGCNSNQLSTPFGFEAIPRQIGHFSHLFKGPIADVEGHNCWLNSVLPLLAAAKPLVRALLSNKNIKSGTFTHDLALLVRIWCGMKHDSQYFRDYFEFAYGRVWFHLQTMGYRYGFDYRASDAVRTIVERLQHEGLETGVSIETNSELVQLHPGNTVLLLNEKNNRLPDSLHFGTGPFSIRSFISHQVLATTPTGYDVSHFTCIAYPNAHPNQQKGYYYYNDALDLQDKSLSDFKGGFVTCVESLGSLLDHVPVCILERRDEESSVPSASISNAEMENLIASVTLQNNAPCNRQEEEEPIWYTGWKDILSMKDALHLTRLIRFAVVYMNKETVESITTGSVMPEIVTGTQVGKSECRLRQLFHIELKMIAAQGNAVPGFQQLAKLGVLDSFIFMPDSLTQSVKLDWMDGIRAAQKIVQEHNTQVSSEQLLAALLSPFHSLVYLAKTKKKRKTSVAQFILMEVFLLSKTEAREVLKFLA